MAVSVNQHARRQRRFPAREVIAGLLVLGCAATAQATEFEFDKAPGQTQAEALQAGAQVKEEKDTSFVVMPIPLVNPSLGTGVVLAAVAFYQPEGSVRPWMTGAGALWSDNGSTGGGIFQKAYLNGDKFRVSGGLGKVDLNLRFFGIGNSAADRGQSIDIEQRGDFALVQGLAKVSDRQFLGVRIRKVGVETRVPIDPPLFPDLELPPLDAQVDLVGPGLVYQYDARDSEIGPSSGIYATGTLQWNLPSWGSDREYQRFDGAFNAYRKLGPNGVLAVRAAVCDVSDDAPFFDLCLFGSNNDLRGYEAGQYRDSTLLATQAEYRWQFSRRWGMVAFAGIGGVAPDFGSYRGSDLLPAGGLGLRFKASTAYNVNVSVDYAVGRDSDAVYFTIGEAF